MPSVFADCIGSVFVARRRDCLGYPCHMPLTITDRLLLGAYSLVMTLLLPTTLYHLVWRGLRQKEYLQRWDERFAFYPGGKLSQCLWLHAVSVGEVNAAAPLIRRLQARHPRLPMLITTVTPTGSARVAALFGDSVLQVYLPYDTPGAVRHFLDHFRPRLALVLETEIWPNLFSEVARRRIPLLIVNARLSERSLRGYRLIRPLIRAALKAVNVLAAQSEADLLRYRQLGLDASQGEVSGNIKYDLELPAGLAEQAAQWRQGWGDRPVWIAASTHAEEEAAVIDAHREVLRRFPTALLLWAPRHPERFAAVAEQAANAGLRVGNRREGGQPAADCQCFVINSLGELLAFYAASDVAFVGGSLQPIGGHNLLEPAAVGVPALVGPHTFNFEEIAEVLLQSGAAQRVADGAALAPAVIELLADGEQRRRRGDNGRRCVEDARGALERTLRRIEPFLPAIAAD
jgi:3-deoxy-D-manno-octulosonic-acid transferase